MEIEKSPPKKQFPEIPTDNLSVRHFFAYIFLLTKNICIFYGKPCNIPTHINVYTDQHRLSASALPLLCLSKGTTCLPRLLRLKHRNLLLLWNPSVQVMMHTSWHMNFLALFPLKVTTTCFVNADKKNKGGTNNHIEFTASKDQFQTTWNHLRHL